MNESLASSQLTEGNPSEEDCSHSRRRFRARPRRLRRRDADQQHRRHQHRRDDQRGRRRRSNDAASDAADNALDAAGNAARTPARPSRTPPTPSRDATGAPTRLRPAEPSGSLLRFRTRAARRQARGPFSLPRVRARRIRLASREETQMRKSLRLADLRRAAGAARRPAAAAKARRRPHRRGGARSSTMPRAMLDDNCVSTASPDDAMIANEAELDGDAPQRRRQCGRRRTRTAARQQQPATSAGIRKGPEHRSPALLFSTERRTADLEVHAAHAAHAAAGHRRAGPCPRAARSPPLRW